MKRKGKGKKKEKEKRSMLGEGGRWGVASVDFSQNV
jgi:hypothetical protein